MSLFIHYLIKRVMFSMKRKIRLRLFRSDVSFSSKQGSLFLNRLKETILRSCNFVI